MVVSAAKAEKILVSLHQDFLDSTRDALDHMEELAFINGEASADAVMAMYRDAHNIKSNAATFGLASVSILSHRLEDFLRSLSTIDENARSVLLRYIDAMRDVVNRSDDLSPDERRELLRSLPLAHNPDFDVEQALDIEIALVTPSGAVGRLVARDLNACGYRVSALSSPWQALQLAVCASPDLIISSVLMDELSGIDLVRALRAMQCTAQQRIAILTSFDDNHAALAGLPDGVPIIRTGKSFKDDLAQALSDVGIA